ncbi:hypothetical protein Y1Q_0019184 [Alligator mississippiensis]|uniref:Uncharacterized protein n=1 Tax=Alligator mississippiensis TaxID=8496 RepID=A0A151MQG0_ALLMI|nr:hypothetical protein Y1Q_0019184 [Alligator mississippiensis]
MCCKVRQDVHMVIKKGQKHLSFARPSSPPSGPALPPPACSGLLFIPGFEFLAPPLQKHLAEHLHDVWQSSSNFNLHQAVSKRNDILE